MVTKRLLCESCLLHLLASSVGDNFIFGLPVGPEPPPLAYDIIIGSPVNEASYSIETLGGLVASGTASLDSSDTASADSSFQVTSSGFEDRMKGIRVYATSPNPITVLVIMRYAFLPNFHAAILIHPNEDFEEEEMYVYYAMSTSNAGLGSVFQSSILLVGNQNDTTITITPSQSVTLPLDAQADSPLVDIAAGASHVVTLNYLQTLAIFSSLDLTGTKIVSDKPLTVMTGHECALIPDGLFFCEPMYVQIPPTFLWGQLFLLAPLTPRSSQFYKLVASEDSTSIAHRCVGNDPVQGLTSLNAAESFSITVTSDSYCYLTSSSPVFVVQMAPGTDTDSQGDPGMATVPPLSGHVQSTSFTALDSATFPTSFITVTVAHEHFDQTQIQLDGTQLACSWNDILNIDDDTVVGHGCTAAIADGSHVVSHAGASGVLSVLVYGWNTEPISNSHRGYVYLAGFDFQFPPGKCSLRALSTTTT